MSRTAPIRWAALTVALAAAVGLSAYWTALASRPVESEPPAGANQEAPGLVPIPRAAKPRPAEPTVRDRAYARGRRDGLREGRRAARRDLLTRLGGFSRWKPGAPYVVIASSDGRGIETRNPLEPGARYELCPDRKRVCIKRRD